MHLSRRPCESARVMLTRWTVGLHRWVHCPVWEQIEKVERCPAACVLAARRLQGRDERAITLPFS